MAGRRHRLFVTAAPQELSPGTASRPEARQEILARVGPPEGSTWHLVTPGPTFDEQTAIFAIDYASGLDETLIVRLVDQGGWKISEVRTSIARTATWTGRCAALTRPSPRSESPASKGARRK